jgi:hypothetical protein
MQLRFTIRDLLWLTLVVAMAGEFLSDTRACRLDNLSETLAWHGKPETIRQPGAFAMQLL